MSQIDKQHKDLIQKYLLDWFAHTGRQFPWRLTTNSYEVLLAEKLLQQTTVRNDVIIAYQKLLIMYPTICKLSKAENKHIEAIIQPLGLHYRAQEIIKLAQFIIDKHNGVIPKNLELLLQLPGIGDYTARALLCFAFGEDTPVVDTNVARIFYRLFNLPGKMPQNPARKRALIEIAETLVPVGMARQFNWALIDLGALVCKTATPKCAECPLEAICQYPQKGD